MSDTSNFGFGKLVPGFDFLQNLAKGASSSIPQLPNLSNWVAPTISVEELEKRIEELKAVQFWLEQNSRALAATIQALEVQKMTLATLKGMNFSMGDVANAFKLKAADTVTSAAEAVAGAAARVTGRAEEEAPPAQDEAPASKTKAKASKKTQAASTPAPSVVDPLQWWGALTTQFQQIAGEALKDAARQSALDTTRNVATGLAKEAFKTASDMATQFAAKGVQSMQEAAGVKPAAPAKKAPAKKAAKPAAKPAAKAAKPAAKATAKAPARRPARKSAG